MKNSIRLIRTAFIAAVWKAIDLQEIKAIKTARSENGLREWERKLP